MDAKASRGAILGADAIVEAARRATSPETAAFAYVQAVALLAMHAPNNAVADLLEAAVLAAGDAIWPGLARQ